MLAMMRDFFASFSERARLFIVVFLFSLLGVVLSLLLSGLSATLIVILPAILGILQTAKGIWTPEGGSKSKLGLASLGVAFAVVVSSSQWRPLVDELMEPLFEHFPSLRDHLPSNAPSITALLFLAFVILIVNYYARDTSVMKEHSTPIDKEFPEKNYKDALKSFCGVLLDDLNKIDRETNWSAESFTPLDAEVEMYSGSRRLKKVTDLLTAIRSDTRSRVFLVLGDPGSGKSVALRKLCRDLLKEVVRTGKVPLYVNLREWEAKQPWTEETPPSVDELYDFVLNNLRDRGDVFTNDFLQKYFKKMFENGRLFIVLDSFDEIPAVLDVNESSWLIDRLSDAIYKFLAGAHESRGILSSRIFRRPSRKLDAKTILEIRPFTERKIVETLRRSLFYDDALEKTLFNERPEFVPIARNPFAAALISSYAKEHDNMLPKSQAELYSSYVERRLDACQEKVKRRSLNNQLIIQCATAIAWAMLTTETLGLEASVERLTKELPGLPIEDTIEILKYARLGRVGGGDQRRFSFVHRRFNEYFVVQHLIEQPTSLPQVAIPTDSRWRDALVLFCEVANESEAKQIAEYCWSEISQVAEQNVNMSDPQYLRAVHCLRFLTDAFRGRLECIDSFRASLVAFINRQIEENENLLSVKLAVEAVGLIESVDMNVALMKALSVDNSWIDETAFKSCRHLPRLSAELNVKLRLYIDGIDDFSFLKRRRDLRFSLRLSNAFTSLKTFCTWREIDTYCFLSGIALISLFFPFLFLPLSILLLTSQYIVTIVPAKTNASKLLNRRMLGPIMTLIPCILLFLAIRRPLYFRTPREFLVIFGIALLIPWYQIFYYAVEVTSAIRTALRETNMGDLLRDLFEGSVLLVLCGFSAISLIALAPLVFYIEKYPYLSGAILGIALLFFACGFFLPRMRDFRLIRHLARRTPSDRAIIYNDFHQFRTNYGRLRYVQFLRNEGINPIGAWPLGQIPSAENDRGSTLLAQLEEKWLGLDR
jgi:hypothetical protein